MAKPSDTKIKLLETAKIEFTHHGARAVGVDHLCKAAKINKGSFYHYFPSKQALIMACLDAEWDALRDNILSPAFSHQISPLQRISTYFQVARERQEAFHATRGIYPGCLMCTVGNELGLEDPVIRQRIKDYYRRNTAYLYTAFDEAAADRSVKINSSELASYVSLIIPAAFLQVRAFQDLKPLDLANELATRFARQAIEINL